MKKYLKAFTLAETLIVMAVIGVIAALTIPSLGQKVDKSKGLFKKVHSLVERTTGELVNDEQYYRFNDDIDYFGFKEPSDQQIIGTECYTSSVNTCRGTRDKNFKNNKNYKLIKFCNLFTSNINTSGKVKFTIDGHNQYKSNCEFKSSDGVKWVIQEVQKDNLGTGTTFRHPIKGFLISIDTNDEKTPNMPASVGKTEPSKKGVVNTNRQGDTRNRDRFFIYVRYDGKIELPEIDTIAQSYLNSSDLNREEKKE